MLRHDTFLTLPLLHPDLRHSRSQSPRLQLDRHSHPDTPDVEDLNRKESYAMEDVHQMPGATDVHGWADLLEPLWVELHDLVWDQISSPLSLSLALKGVAAFHGLVRSLDPRSSAKTSSTPGTLAPKGVAAFMDWRRSVRSRRIAQAWKRKHRASAGGQASFRRSWRGRASRRRQSPSLPLQGVSRISRVSNLLITPRSFSSSCFG